MLLFKGFGIMPHNILTRFTALIGSVIEVTLLSLALADRINILRMEVEESQVEALILKQQFVQQLEDVVEERTLQLNHTLLEVEEKNKHIKMQRDELEQFSKTDALTGIPNRRQFDNIYSLEWRHARREQSLLSIAMIDIDHFKQFNDTYGHLQGDICLKDVAQALNRTCNRPGDFVARYGGEEFVVIVSQANRETACALIELMVNKIRALKIEHSNSSTGKFLTISVGLASMVPKQGLNPESLVEKADTLLYEAKKNGRDRIQVT